MDDLKTIRLLLENGADVEFDTDDLLDTPLVVAIKKRSEGAAALFIEKVSLVTAYHINLAILIIMSQDLVKLFLWATRARENFG